MNMRFQFEADADGNILWGEADDGFRITAKVEVPEGASEDYGYMTMKRVIVEELEARELGIEATFPYDGQEQHLADDANADTVVDIDITD